MNEKVNILLSLEDDKDKFLMVKQRFYPGKHNYGSGKNFSPSFEVFLRDIVKKIKNNELNKILDILFSSNMQNLDNSLDFQTTDFTDIIIKPFLKHLMYNDINIDFICKDYGFNLGNLSVPKGSVEYEELKSYAMDRELYEEIGYTLKDFNLKIIKESNEYIGIIPKGTKINEQLLNPYLLNFPKLNKKQFLDKLSSFQNFKTLIEDFFKTIPNRVYLFRKYNYFLKNNLKNNEIIKNFLLNATLDNYLNLSPKLKQNKLNDIDIIKELKIFNIKPIFNLDSYFEIPYCGFTHIEDIKSTKPNRITNKLLNMYYSNKYPITIQNIKITLGKLKKKNKKKTKKKKK